MEIRITTKTILQVLHIVSWIIFIGLCIEAGTYLFNVIFTMTINPVAANYFKLHELYQHDSGYFLTQVSLGFIVAVMKALLFYKIVKMLYDKKISLEKPFNEALFKFIANLAYVSIFIGVFCVWGTNYTQWLKEKGINMPDIHVLNLDGGDVWLLMGVALLVIAQIFKKGIEIQNENELTI